MFGYSSKVLSRFHDRRTHSTRPWRYRVCCWVCCELWLGMWFGLIAGAAEIAEGAESTETVPSAALPDVYSQDVARFERLLASGVPDERIEGVQGLSQLKHWPAEPALIERLTDPAAAVRGEVVAALCRLGTSRSVPHLIPLLDDRRWHTRRQVQLALCRMTGQVFPAERVPWQAWWESGTPESHVQGLLAALGTGGAVVEGERIGRKAALRALVHLADATAEESLLRLLDSAPQPPLDEAERSWALEALERVGTERAVPILARQRRDAAAWALGRIGGAQAEAALYEFPRTLAVLMNLDRLHSTRCRPLVPQLIQNMGLVTYRSQPDDLHEPPTPIQRVAANLILRSGAGPELIEAILAELEATAAPAGAAKQVPEPPEALRSLMERFREELRPGFVRNDGTTTSQPLTALYHVANDRALIPRLVPLLHHPAFVPRIYVAMALAKLEAFEALPIMVEIVREGYAFSDAATQVSGKHFDRSQNVRWRGFVCMAIGRLGGDDARQALETFASGTDEFRDIRYGAVVGLGFIASPDSLPVLNRVAEQDPVWMVRDAAQRAIADIELRTQGGAL
jgi:HEAT repeat protein